MTIRDIVLEALHTLSIDQSELARKLGRSPGTVSRWVGMKATPDYDSCLRLAQITGVPARHVLELAGQDPSLAPPERADQAPVLAPDEAEVLALIRQLPRPQRQTVKQMLLGLVRSNRSYGALAAAA